VDDAAVARDFEDAVTRAVTTTSSQVRRVRAVVELQRKAGAEYASQALADTPANEQTPDAGWFKIGSVLCNDTGMMAESNYWDWRKPWGFSRGLTGADGFFSDAGHLTLQNGGLYAEGSAIDQILAWCPLSKTQMGSAGLSWSPVRLDTVSLIADFVSAPAAIDVRLTQWNLQSGVVAHWGDLGAAVSTSLGEHFLVVDASGNHPPLWANGGTNPFSSSHRELLRMTIATVGTTDHLYGTKWTAYGGL
jgi:hypothetical protein